TWVTSQWKNPSIPGQFSADINIVAVPRAAPVGAALGAFAVRNRFSRTLNRPSCKRRYTEQWGEKTSAGQQTPCAERKRLGRREQAPRPRANGPAGCENGGLGPQPDAEAQAA